MKEKIFKKMIEYGWNLNDWFEIYDGHYEFINILYGKLTDNEEKGKNKFKIGDIDEQDLLDFTTFMSDFLRALNDVDNEEKTTINDNWYKVTIHNNPFSKENKEIAFVADSRKIYEITFNDGKKDLIKILSADLYINVKSILKGSYKLGFNEFIPMVNTGRIKMTDYEEE